jgi:ABC-type xylose transport system substrate-binding protein
MNTTEILAVVDSGTVAAISALVALGVSAITFVRLAGGKANERQIEPTSLAAIQAELRGQTQTLNKLDREMGGVSASLINFQREISEMKTAESACAVGVHARISGISRELAATTARVDGLEKRESA